MSARGLVTVGSEGPGGADQGGQGGGNSGRFGSHRRQEDKGKQTVVGEELDNIAHYKLFL